MLSVDDPIATVLYLSAGAEFHRYALQVNPHHCSASEELVATRTLFGARRSVASQT